MVRSLADRTFQPRSPARDAAPNVVNKQDLSQRQIRLGGARPRAASPKASPVRAFRGREEALASKSWDLRPKTPPPAPVDHTPAPAFTGRVRIVGVPGMEGKEVELIHPEEDGNWRVHVLDDDTMRSFPEKNLLLRERKKPPPGPEPKPEVAESGRQAERSC